MFQIHLSGEEQPELVRQHVPVSLALPLHHRQGHRLEPVRLSLPRLVKVEIK